MFYYLFLITTGIIILLKQIYSTSITPDLSKPLTQELWAKITIFPCLFFINFSVDTVLSLCTVLFYPAIIVQSHSLDMPE